MTPPWNDGSGWMRNLRNNMLPLHCSKQSDKNHFAMFQPTWKKTYSSQWIISPNKGFLKNNPKSLENPTPIQHHRDSKSLPLMPKHSLMGSPWPKKSPVRCKACRAIESHLAHPERTLDQPAERVVNMTWWVSVGTDQHPLKQKNTNGNTSF